MASLGFMHPLMSLTTTSMNVTAKTWWLKAKAENLQPAKLITHGCSFNIHFCIECREIAKSTVEHNKIQAHQKREINTKRKGKGLVFHIKLESETQKTAFYHNTPIPVFASCPRVNNFLSLLPLLFEHANPVCQSSEWHYSKTFD